MTANEELLKQLAQKELNRRKGLSQEKAIDIVELAALPWQKEFVRDPAPKKALFGERRGAKTTAMAIAAIDKCLKKPFSKVLYIGLYAESVKEAMYDEILPRLIRKFSIPATLIGEDEMRFDNGSIIYLHGLDANKKQKHKVRGVKSSMNIMDEMQSYTQNPKIILDEVIGPTAADTKAQTIIGGTAGNTHGKSYWYEITKDNTKEEPIARSVLHPEWKIYRCEWSKNTAIDEQTGNRVCDNIKEYLDEQLRDHPGKDKEPSWRQEWNAEWIIDTSSRIYRYSDINKTDKYPNQQFLHGAIYMLGLDLGFSPDPNAFVIGAFNLKYDDRLYILKSYEKGKLPTRVVAEEIRMLQQRYHLSFRVADGGAQGKQIVTDFNETYGLQIEAAEKAHKFAHQNILNSDFETEKIVIYEPDNQGLIRQLENCIWDTKKLEEDDKYVEDSSCANHLTDALLYLHHYSRHQWYKPGKTKLTPELMFEDMVMKQHNSEYGAKHMRSAFTNHDNFYKIEE